MNVRVHFGPQAPAQRCRISTDALTCGEDQMARLLLEILPQLDFVSAEFVDHRPGQDQDQGCTVAQPLLHLLSEGSSQYSHRCVWRSLSNGDLTAAIWDASTESVREFDVHVDLVENSTLIIGAVTSDDAPMKDGDTAYTKRVLDEAGGGGRCGYDFLKALCSSDLRFEQLNTELLRIYLGSELSRRYSVESPPRTEVTKGFEGRLVYPRKPPLSTLLLPQYTQPSVVSIRHVIDVEGVFTDLHSASGHPTMESICATTRSRPETSRYQELLGSLSGEPHEPAVTAPPVRLATKARVASWISLTFPFIEAGLGPALIDDLVSACHAGPVRAGSGRIIAAHHETPAFLRRVETSSMVSKLKGTPAPIPTVSDTSVLGSKSMELAVRRRREEAHAEAAREARKLGQRPPARSFVTEDEFGFLVARIQRM